jgi:hypothetical protein
VKKDGVQRGSDVNKDANGISLSVESSNVEMVVNGRNEKVDDDALKLRRHWNYLKQATNRELKKLKRENRPWEKGKWRQTT